MVFPCIIMMIQMTLKCEWSCQGFLEAIFNQFVLIYKAIRCLIDTDNLETRKEYKQIKVMKGFFICLLIFGIRILRDLYYKSFSQGIECNIKIENPIQHHLYKIYEVQFESVPQFLLQIMLYGFSDVCYNVYLPRRLIFWIGLK